MCRKLVHVCDQLFSYPILPFCCLGSVSFLAGTDLSFYLLLQWFLCWDPLPFRLFYFRTVPMSKKKGFELHHQGYKQIDHSGLVPTYGSWGHGLILFDVLFWWSVPECIFTKLHFLANWGCSGYVFSPYLPRLNEYGQYNGEAYPHPILPSIIAV